MVYEFMEDVFAKRTNVSPTIVGRVIYRNQAATKINHWINVKELKSSIEIKRSAESLLVVGFH